MLVMAASYSDIAFKLYLPTCVSYEDHVNVKFKFEYKTGNTEKIMYYKAVLTDKVNVSHSDESHHAYLASDQRIFFDSFNIWQEGKKIFLNEAILKMYFFSNTSQKIEVTFRVHTSNKAQLLEVAKNPMSENEKQVYNSLITMNHLEATCGAPNNKCDNIQSSYQNLESFTENNISRLEQYKKALKEEKLFLMHEGGRKYKVTNGKLISSVKGVYSYIFDLETELYISDDAPVKISTGIATVSGNVLMCEDFQIIVQLESNIGDKIGSAVISVEPWKLLEAIENRLQSEIDIKESKIATKLFNDGPAMATNKPVDKIPKGQDAVIKKAITDPVCIVWGPPGTGKTHTMSEMVIRFLNDGKTVLIVSHSNVSVDGVVTKIGKLLREKNQQAILESGKVLRYGYIRDEQLNKDQYMNSFYYAATKNRKLNKQLDALQEDYNQIRHTKGMDSQSIIEVRKEISKIREQIREQEKCYVEKASVVATTISKVVVDKLFQDKKYDVVMFDEVSMAYVLQVVCAATFSKEHLICVGDFMQLAPIAQSKAKEILCQDIFSFLGINRCGKPYYHPWLVMLDEQRRMHPKISAFVNKYVYSGMLKDHPSTLTSRDAIVTAELFGKEAINLIDMTGCYCAASKNVDNSRYNILSALISFAVAEKTKSSVENVSIITPYSAQTKLIRALILDYKQKEIRCATVHQFQGSESDVIFFDAVESYPSKKPGWLMGKDFNSILCLINVAVTRAKGKLVAIADYRFWEKNYKNSQHTFYRLLNYLAEKGNVVQHREGAELEKLIENLLLEVGPEFYLKPEDYLERFKKDMGNAKGKIVISLPCGSLNSDYENEAFKCVKEAKRRGLQVLIKSNDFDNLPDKWKEYTLETDNAVFPIVMIDDYISWYGVPLAPWKFVDGDMSYMTVCSIACRIKGKHTAEMIKSLSDLEHIETKGVKVKLMPRTKTFGLDSDVPVGLAAYVSKNIKCPSCMKPLTMSKGKSGKTILWCKDCKKTELLRTDDIKHYMLINHVKCPQHKCDMTAKVGPYGLYIKCEAGHFIKPEEI